MSQGSDEHRGFLVGVLAGLVPGWSTSWIESGGGDDAHYGSLGLLGYLEAACSQNPMAKFLFFLKNSR